jgi:hypothetical protein
MRTREGSRARRCDRERERERGTIRRVGWMLTPLGVLLVLAGGMVGSSMGPVWLLGTVYGMIALVVGVAFIQAGHGLPRWVPVYLDRMTNRVC